MTLGLLHYMMTTLKGCQEEHPNQSAIMRRYTEVFEEDANPSAYYNATYPTQETASHF
jgi:hypothetical protein